MTQFTDYERAADTLLFLSDQITLDFVVTFATKDRNGQRSFFHTDSVYDTNKYTVTGSYRSIKRKMTNFYFVISNKKSFEGGVVLKPNDVYLLKGYLETIVLPWFLKDSNIFSVIDNRLVITGQFTPLDYIKNEYTYLRFTPIAMQYENGKFIQGTRIYINSEDVFVDIDVDKLYAFYYILANTDMYNAACNLATYTKTPPYNVNEWRPAGLGAGGFNQDDNAWSEQDAKPATDFLKGLGSKKKGKDK